MRTEVVDETAVENLLDLQRYPITDIQCGAGLALAQQCREAYQSTGLCLLPEILKPHAVQRLTTEAQQMSDHAYFCRSSHDAYLSLDGDDKNTKESGGALEHTFVGSVPYDRMTPDSSLKQLYLWDPLKDFIAYVLSKPTFHRLADPFGACSINVFVEGGAHGWHFDEAEFTVTLMLQAPETGGIFEYAPQIRGLNNERQLVADILKGDRDRVVELPFSAGTLLIFGGSQTLHRVTEVGGSTPRLVPVLCYSEKPGVVNSPEVRQLFWGRAEPDDTH